MTREEFLNMNWNDSHVSYDIQVEIESDFRKRSRIAYMTLSKAYPNCLCLIAENKDFPLMNSYCGIHQNLCPNDIIKYLNHKSSINKIITILDGTAYDIKANTMYINGIDGEILFDIIPYELTKDELLNKNIINKDEIEFLEM